MFKPTVTSLLLLLALCTAGASVCEAQPSNAKVFRAGAALSNITPPLGEPIVGGWAPFPAEMIHDELHARCLVLDDGRTKLAIVVCDNVGIPREVYDAAKQRIEQHSGIPASHVLCSATHTHSATTARGPNKVAEERTLSEYQQFLAGRIADGVARALYDLQPARIGWGSAEAPEHVFNRRWRMKEGDALRNPFGGIDRVRMNPPRAHPDLIEPAGPIDPEVAFLSVQSTAGEPIALLANYSLHYVGGVGQGEVSADYFAIFAERVGELLGAEGEHPPFVGIMSNGTSGDINNINFRQNSPTRKPYEQMTRVAHSVAEKVAAAHSQVEFHAWVPLRAAYRELSLRVRKPTEAQLAYFEQVTAKPETAEPYHRREKTYARRARQLAESSDEISAPLQILGIGDLAISAIPFEVFVEIGLKLKDESPFQETFTISLANGSFGYLPTPEQHELGGYETWMGTNNVEVEASTKITENLLEMHHQLQP